MVLDSCLFVLILPLLFVLPHKDLPFPLMGFWGAVALLKSLVKKGVHEVELGELIGLTSPLTSQQWAVLWNWWMGLPLLLQVVVILLLLVFVLHLFVKDVTELLQELRRWFASRRPVRRRRKQEMPVNARRRGHGAPVNVPRRRS